MKADTTINAGLQRLAGLLLRAAPHDGSFAVGVGGAHAVRTSTTSAELVHGLHRPALCIVAQGAKTVMLGDESYDYDPARMLIFSLDLPIAAMIRQATMAAPYLSLRLDFDLARLAELIVQVYPDGVPLLPARRAICVADATEAILDAAARLVALAHQPDDAQLLAPLIVDEMLIRLLRGPFGARLAQLGHAESHRVTRVVAWLRNHFDEPMRIDDLADMAHMSASSLHQHFKNLTSMSPLQFQKTLRLQQARRLMLSNGMTASSAGQQVGYLSASQFSREYARHFGSSPSGDMVRLRDHRLADVACSQSAPGCSMHRPG
ncbi:AraC family transcriptional regulator [Massilia eurypsychrophila]|uniref:AraC family transcriptional regulator n=1 Tax=Massilia eurypsychrophila TaxID=1485217 RepID=A0A2G8TKI4_9BURK|nr:AraC family transcriptional regulator [Massilia eurypsychrophila]PIL46557.1 AraC family transcriptional regulator [Massilia eurypsychrophila]